MATYGSNLDGKANVGSGGGGSIIVEDEGGVVPGGPHTTLDFVGAGVTASNAGGGTATITIPGGSGGGDDTYTAPNEYFVDPSLAEDATKRQYQTVAAAIAAGDTAAFDPVIIRLADFTEVAWGGSGMPAGSLIIYAVKNASLTLEDGADITTDSFLILKNLSLGSGSPLTVSCSYFEVENCQGQLFYDIGDTPSSNYKVVLIKDCTLELGMVTTVADTSGGFLAIEGGQISFASNRPAFWDHTAGTENWGLTIKRCTLFCVNAAGAFFIENTGGSGEIYNLDGSGGPLLLNVDLIVSGYGSGTLTIVSADGYAGPVWTDCRITIDDTVKTGQDFIFGDEGTNQGLEIVYPGRYNDPPLDAPNNTVARSVAEPNYGPITFDARSVQWRGANRTVFLRGSSGAIPGIGVPQTLTTIFEGDGVVNLAPYSSGALYRIQGTIIVGSNGANNAVWDVDWLLEADSSPVASNTLAGGIPTLIYETTVGQFTVVLLPVVGPPTGFSVVVTKTSGSANVLLFAKLQITQEST